MSRRAKITFVWLVSLVYRGETTLVEVAGDKDEDAVLAEIGRDYPGAVHVLPSRIPVGASTSDCRSGCVSDIDGQTSHASVTYRPAYNVWIYRIYAAGDVRPPSFMPDARLVCRVKTGLSLTFYEMTRDPELRDVWQAEIPVEHEVASLGSHVPGAISPGWLAESAFVPIG